MGPWQHALLAGSNERSLPPPRRFRRRLIVACVAAVMLAVPVAVNASHNFSDVPTSNTFHAAISTLYGSRITGGCGGGKYCPNASVTRGQMAAFLVRGLGRIASVVDGDADDWVPFMQPPAAPGEFHPFGGVAPISFRHGGGTGGTGLVHATGTIQVFTPEATVCPCEVQAYLLNNTTGEFSPTYFGMIGSEFAPVDPDLALVVPPIPVVAYAETTISMSYAFTVDSGVVNDYLIALRIIPSNDPTVDLTDDLPTGWTANLETSYVPFDENGGNPTTTNQTQSTPHVRIPQTRR